MGEKKREIITGRAFYFMPSPFCALKITIEERYNHERMENAICELEKVHPIISNGVVQEENRLWFREIGKHVRLHRYSEETVDWKAVYQTEVSEALDLRMESGVKIAVLEHSDCFDLILLFHHIYADGISAKYLLSDLLTIYGTGQKMDVREPLSEIGIEQLCEKVTVSRETVRKTEHTLQTWEQNRMVFGFDSFKQMNELHHKLARYELTVGGLEKFEFLKLRKRCKEHGVTVNSALATAILAGIQAEEAINTLIPVNARPVLELKNDTGLANLASSVNLKLCYESGSDFWTNVVGIHEKMYKARTDTAGSMERLYTFMRFNEDIFGAGYYAQYGIYKKQDMLETLREVLLPDMQRKTLDFSNIGAMPYEIKEGNIRVRECYAIPNFTPTCDWMFAVVSLEDALTFSFVYSSRRISGNAAEEIMHRMRCYLCENL